METIRGVNMPSIKVLDNQAVIPSSVLDLENGDSFEVTGINKADNTIVLEITTKQNKKNESFMDVINSMKGHRSFNSTQEIDDFIRKERNSWD